MHSWPLAYLAKFCVFPLVMKSLEFHITLAKDFNHYYSWSLGSKPSRWRSNDTDHPSVLTPGPVMEQIKVMFLAMFPTVPGNWSPLPMGHWRFRAALFYRTNHLVFNKWLSIIIAAMSGKLKSQAFVSPFQTGPISDCWWHWHFVD